MFRVGSLRVLFERSTGPLTGIVLAARAGSRFDGDKPGIAHFAEHMLFQGATTRDHTAINQRAAELGGDHDASTSYEDLNVTFQVLNADAPEALALIADQVRRSTVPEDRLENERQVVAQEIRGHREDAVSYVADETWARFFRGGLRLSPSGTLASVRSITASDVRRFLRRRLVGRNLVLSIVGDPPLGEVRRVLTEEFASLAAGSPCVANGARIARRGEIRLRRSGLTQLYWTTLFAVPARRRELLALGLALEIVGTDPDGRLYHEIRERHGLSYDLWADFRVAPNGRRSWSGQSPSAVRSTDSAPRSTPFSPRPPRRDSPRRRSPEHDAKFGTGTRGSRRPRSTEPLRMLRQFSTVLPAWTRPKRWCARWPARRSRLHGVPRCALRVSPEF